MHLTTYLILFIAITGLYAAFLTLHYISFQRRLRKRTDDYCVAFTSAVAKIEEVDIEPSLQKEVSKLSLHKLGYKKPRLDDDIDYRKVDLFVNEIDKQNLTSIERASLNVCKRTLDRGRFDCARDIRGEISDAFSIIIKLHAKYLKE